MPRRTKAPNITEVSGQAFPTLAAAQRSALAEFSNDLAGTIQRMIENGTLTIIDGKITPRDLAK